MEDQYNQISQEIDNNENHELTLKELEYMSKVNFSSWNGQVHLLNPAFKA